MEDYTIDISTRSVESSCSSVNTENFVKAVLREMGVDTAEVSIVFCNDEFISQLNKTYRHKNGSTDVLSFSQYEGYDIANAGDSPTKSLFGDVVVSLETLSVHAEKFEVAEEEELRRVLIHGILHLSGMDHEGNDEKEEPMLKWQEELLHRLEGEHLF